MFNRFYLSRLAVFFLPLVLSSFVAGAGTNLCKQSVKEIAGLIKSSVQEPFVTHSGNTFKQGETVDFYFAANTKSESISGAIPLGASGIVVGSFNKAGNKIVVFDRGEGRIASIPAAKLNLISYSSARIEPSTGKKSEKLLAKMRGTYNFLSNTLLPSALNTLPILTAVVTTAYVGGEVISFTWDFAKENTLLASGTAAVLGLSSMAHSKVASVMGKTFTLSLSGVIGAGYLAGDITKFAIKFLFSPIKSVSDIQGLVGIDLLKLKEWAENKNIINMISRRKGEILETPEFRMFVVPGKNSKDPSAFVERAKALLSDASTVKNYLYKIGLKAKFKKSKVSIWVSEDKLSGVPGPLAVPGMRLISLSPIKASLWNHLVARWKKEEGYPATTREISNLFEKEVIGHEMLHMVLGWAISESKHAYIGTSLEEFFADYFSASALNLELPIMGESSIDGQSLREGIRRSNYTEAESRRLNYNQLAQMKGGYHRDSQVLFRLMWSLRTELGREKLDPMIIDSLYYLKIIWKTDFVILAKPKNRGEQGDALASYLHYKEAYVFITALLKVNSSDKETYNLILDKAEEAGFYRESLIRLDEISGW